MESKIECRAVAGLEVVAGARGEDEDAGGLLDGSREREACDVVEWEALRVVEASSSSSSPSSSSSSREVKAEEMAEDVGVGLRSQD